MSSDVNKQEGSLDSFIKETINKLLGEFSHLLNDKTKQQWSEQKKKLDEKGPDEKDLFALLDLLLELLRLLMRGPELTQSSHAGKNQRYFEGLTEAVEGIRSTFNPTAGGPAQAASSSGSHSNSGSHSKESVHSAEYSQRPDHFSSQKKPQPKTGGAKQDDSRQGSDLPQKRKKEGATHTRQQRPSAPGGSNNHSSPEPTKYLSSTEVYTDALKGLRDKDELELRKAILRCVHPDKNKGKEEVAGEEAKAFAVAHAKFLTDSETVRCENLKKCGNTLEKAIGRVKAHVEHMKLNPANLTLQSERTAKRKEREGREGVDANRNSKAKKEFGGDQGPANKVEAPCTSKTGGDGVEQVPPTSDKTYNDGSGYPGGTSPGGNDDLYTGRGGIGCGGH